MLIAWVIRKASRAAHRADGVVDQVIDTSVDKVGRLVLGKLEGDSALTQLQIEAERNGHVSDRTRTRLELAVAEATEEDPAFGQALTAALENAQAADGGAVAPGGIAVSGGVHSSGSGTAIGAVGRIDTFHAGAPQDPPRADRA